MPNDIFEIDLTDLDSEIQEAPETLEIDLGDLELELQSAAEGDTATIPSDPMGSYTPEGENGTTGLSVAQRTVGRGRNRRKVEEVPVSTPETAQEWKDAMRSEMGFFERAGAELADIARGVAYGDNLLANTYRLLTNPRQEGETEEQYQKRLQVEAEIRDKVLLDRGANTVGSVLSDVALFSVVAPLVPFTAPALVAEGAAAGVIAGAVSREARGEEQTAGAVAKDAAIGGAFGGAAYGVGKVGEAILARAMAKSGATPDEVVQETIKALPEPEWWKYRDAVKASDDQPLALPEPENWATRQRMREEAAAAPEALPAPESRVIPESRRLGHENVIYSAPDGGAIKLSREADAPAPDMEFGLPKVLVDEVEEYAFEQARKLHYQFGKKKTRKVGKSSTRPLVKALHNSDNPTIQRLMKNPETVDAVRKLFAQKVGEMQTRGFDEVVRDSMQRAYRRAARRAEVTTPVGEGIRGVGMRVRADKLRERAAREAQQGAYAAARGARESIPKVATPEERAARSQARAYRAAAGQKLRISRLQREIKRESQAVAKEAEKLRAKGYNPTAAMEQAAANRGLFDELGVTSDDVARVNARIKRRAKVAQERIKRRGGIFRGMDNLLGHIDTRISRIDLTLGRELRRMEADLHVLRGTKNALRDNLEQALKGLDKATRKELSWRVNSGGLKEGERVLAKLPQHQAERIREAMEAIIDFKEKQADVMFMGAGDVMRMDKRVHWPRKRKGGTYKDAERDYQDYLATTNTRMGKSGNLKERVIESIPRQEADNYEDFVASMDEMLERAIRQNQTRLFLGDRGNMKPLAYGARVEEGINKLVANELAAGRLPEELKDELTKLLQSRLIAAEAPTGSTATVIQDVTRMSLLGHFDTALVNLSDTANIVAHNGFRNVLGAIIDRLPPGLDPKKAGLTFDEVASDFGVSGTPADSVAKVSNKFMSRTFKLTGLAYLDKSLVRLAMRSSYRKIVRKLKTKRGTEELLERYSGFGSTEEVMETLARFKRGGEINPDMLSFLVEDIMDIRPVAKSQTSETFAKDNSLLRLISTLKSFPLKQLDITRRRVWDAYRDGRKAEAAKSAVALVTAWTMIGVPITAAIGHLKGQDVKIEDEVVDNLLLLVGASRYTMEKAEKEGPAAYLNAWIGVSPLGLFERLFMDAKALVERPEDYRILRNIPVIGELLDAAFGGLDRERIKAAREARAEARRELRGTPTLQERREMNRRRLEKDRRRYLEN